MKGGIVFLALLAAAYGQKAEGQDFTVVFLDNYNDCPLDRPVDVYICNKAGNPTANVDISLPDINYESCPLALEASVRPDSCQKVSLCNEIRHTYADGSLATKVVTITSDADVTIQAFNVEKFSADSFLLLPWTLSGLTHRVLSYTKQHIQTQFGIVTREKTTVRITIPDREGETITVDYNGQRYSNGEVLTFILSPDTSFLSQSVGDLTGTLIQTDKPVAVFTGNVRSFNDFTEKSRDHLIEQVPSTVKWGSQYVYVPTMRDNKGDVVRIMSRLGNTRVELIDWEVTTRVLSNGGDFIEVDLYNTTHIRANRPVLVAVIVRSQEGKAAGIDDPNDPSLYFLPATDQYDTDYYMPMFADAEEEPYETAQVIVSVPGSGSTGTVSVDGRPVTIQCSRPRSNQGLAFCAGNLEVDPTRSHTFSSNNRPFMAVVYGASDRESFASPLGVSYNLRCSETVMVERDGIDNDCDGAIDEETCGNEADDDGDGLVDEDCTGQAQAIGSKFLVSFMTNIVLDSNVRVDETELYVSALEEGTFVNITVPLQNDFFSVINAEARMGEAKQFEIPPILRNNDRLGVSSISDNGILVESTKPIVLYGINKKQFSTDGFLGLPTTVTGSEYIAFCNHPINFQDDRCEFAALSDEDITIHIRLPQGITAEPMNGGTTYQGGEEYSFDLKAFQVLEIQSLDDITGTVVWADDQRFSFFSGNVRTRVPESRGSRDHLVEQLQSTDTWGQYFSLIPTPRELREGDLWKIIASQRNTEVMYYHATENDPNATISETFTLQSQGSFREINPGFETAIHIQSNRPILVVQISKSATNRDTDPAAILVPPEGQWSKNYIFVTPLTGQTQGGRQLPFNNTVLIAINSQFKSGLRFQGVNNQIVDLSAEDGWIPIPGTENEGLVYAIEHGQSRLFHIDDANESVTYMAIAFGRADRETYGNAIGLRLSRNAVRCQPSEMVEGDGVDNDCDGSTDEEVCNQIDDDLDGGIDEDCGIPPSAYQYYLVFEENLVEFPRNYALEIYVGNYQSSSTRCRLFTPDVYKPVYDNTVTIEADSVAHFAVSAGLRSLGTRLMWNAIVVACDNTVSVMGVNKETFSNDAFVAFEYNSLGQEYYTVSYSPPTHQTQFAVIAVEEGQTSVELSFKAPVVWRETTYTQLSLELSQNELFQAQSNGDLTGSKITADKKVAVYSGNVRTKVQLSGSRDHLAVQIPPVSKWGTEFAIAPIFFRTVGDLIRVVAGENGIGFNFQGQSYNLARAGDFEEIEVASDSNGGRLRSTGPVLVVQMMKSQNGANNPERADPCFILNPPTSQYVSKTSLVTPLYTEGYYKSGDDYQNVVTVIVPRGQEGGIEINGLRVGNRESMLNGTRTIEGTSFSAVDIKLSLGGLNAYTISHTDSNVEMGGYLIGIADRESYCVSIADMSP